MNFEIFGDFWDFLHTSNNSIDKVTIEMNSPENKSQYTLLGFLVMKPYSGYEMKTTIEGSTGFFWKESYGQIYPNLKKLVENGWATVEGVAQDNRPDKKIYGITIKGRKKLTEWLERSVEVKRIRSEMLLKIFFGGFATPEISITHLQTELKEEEALLEKYREIKRHLENCNPSKHIQFSLLTLDYGIGQAKHNIEWCKRSISKLKG